MRIILESEEVAPDEIIQTRSKSGLWARNKRIGARILRIT